MAKYALEVINQNLRWEIGYDEHGILRSIIVENGKEMTIEQLHWTFSEMPKAEHNVMERWGNSQKIRVTKIPEDLRFDVFWEKYGYKIGGKTRVIKEWQALKDAEKAACLVAIPKYDRWLKMKDGRIEKLYPQTFLSQRRWENDFTIK